jgi:hypothetical protein
LKERKQIIQIMAADPSKETQRSSSRTLLNAFSKTIERVQSSVMPSKKSNESTSTEKISVKMSFIYFFY